MDKFILEDGRVYRTRVKHQKIQEVCRDLADVALAEKAFCLSHAASIKAREQNERKPTPARFLEDVQSSCVEHGHGGLWNSMSYNTKDVISIDMKSCYPASFQGKVEAN